jgi:hypothetical protein
MSSYRLASKVELFVEVDDKLYPWFTVAHVW